MGPRKAIAAYFCMLFIVLSAAPLAHATLQYFGYYNVNGLPVDSRDHIPEIGARGNTNIGIITVSDTTKLPQYLTEMRRYGMYAILGVTAMFESPAWVQNWENIKTAIRGREDVIYGFYFDEVASRGVVGGGQFREYTRKIRTDYPNKATMLIEGYPAIYLGWIDASYLEYVTDFGFDFYPTVTMEGVTANFNNEWFVYQKNYHVFSGYARGKKVWLIPDGYGYPSVPTDYLGIVFSRYWEHAKTHPEVVGMLVFRYDPGDGTYYTIQDVLNPSSRFYNPGVAGLHDTIGKAIIANAAPLPTPFPTIPPSPTPTIPPSPLASPKPTAGGGGGSVKPGDANKDNKVDGVDYAVWLTHYNRSVSGPANGDFNNSGRVDGIDYVIWVNNYGT